MTADRDLSAPTVLRFLRAHRFQKQVAKDAGLSVFYLCRLERPDTDLTKVRYDVLERIAKALGPSVSVEQILGKAPVPGYPPEARAQ